jgi:3-deoxy-D-manno-octulosonic-acid transferase
MHEHPSASRGLDWRLLAYDLLLLALCPLIVLYVVWRMVIQGKSRAGFRERLGLVPPEAAELGHHDDPVVWFQACSVGEVAAVEPVVKALRELEPMAHVVLTTTTPTGYDLARKRSLELDALFYFPFDLPFVVGHALGAVKPDVLVMVDTELWPNVLATARSMGITTAVINGRISDRAFPRDMAARPVMGWIMSNLDQILAQSEKDADRFRALGASPARVQVYGNSKFDEAMPGVSAAEGAKLRLELGLNAEAPVLVAGSTREGEEEKVLEAFEKLRHDHLDAQLVIAPRHPDRGDHIERLVTERGFSVHRRSRVLADAEAASRETAPTSQVRVVILDTIGELTRVYSLATVVFVGGSLVPWGGHNILQPIALGKPTLMGPHMHNQQDLADIALQEQAAITVHDPAELAEVAGRIIASPGEQQLLATRGQAMLDKHRGAARRYAEAVSDMLPPRPA